MIRILLGRLLFDNMVLGLHNQFLVHIQIFGLWKQPHSWSGKQVREV